MAKFQATHYLKSVKRDVPLFKIVHYKTAQPQNFNQIVKINNYKTINTAEDAPWSRK